MAAVASHRTVQVRFGLITNARGAGGGLGGWVREGGAPARLVERYPQLGGKWSGHEPPHHHATLCSTSTAAWW